MTGNTQADDPPPQYGTPPKARPTGRASKSTPGTLAPALVALPLILLSQCIQGVDALANTPIPHDLEQRAERAADLYHYDAGLLIHQLHLVRGESRRELQHQLASVVVAWQQALLWARLSGRENDIAMSCTVLEALPKRAVDRAGRGRDPFELCEDLELDPSLEIDLYDDNTALIKEVYAWVR